MIRHVALLQQPRDPGLQAERTALAWNRTGLAVLINAVLALRSGWESNNSPISFLALALLVASSAWIYYGAWRRRVLVTYQGGISPSSIEITFAALVAFCACVVGVASIIYGSNLF